MDGFILLEKIVKAMLMQEIYVKQIEGIENM